MLLTIPAPRGEGMRRFVRRPELCGVYTFSRDRAQWRTVYAETARSAVRVVAVRLVSESGREVPGVARGPRPLHVSQRSRRPPERAGSAIATCAPPVLGGARDWPERQSRAGESAHSSLRDVSGSRHCLLTAPTTFCLSPTGGWVDPLRTVSSCHQDQRWRRSPVDGAAPRPRPPAPGVQSGFAISLLHRSQSAASSLTFSGCAAARLFFSPISSARLKS